MQCHHCREKGCSKGEPCVDFESRGLYDGETLRILKVSADVEALYYCTLNRLEESMEFARRMGYRRLGLAFCVGFSDEAAMVGEILSKDFEVRSVCCKVSAVTKDSVGAT